MEAGAGIEAARVGAASLSRQIGLRLGRLARHPELARLRAVAIRHPGRVVIALGALAWPLALVGGVAGGRQAPRAHVPPDYAIVAGHLADAWQAGRGASEAGKDLDVTLAELRNAALDLERIDAGDPEIRSIAREAGVLLREMESSLVHLRTLPRPPGQLELSVESFLRGFVFDVRGLIRRHEQVSGVQEALFAEGRRLAATIGKFESFRLLLPRIAARYSGQARAAAPALRIDFDEAWGPTGPGDWLTLVNESGGDLHNATILVEVQGEANDVARSVHFVPAWGDRARIDARYAVGEDAAGLTVGRRTVAGVRGVVVSLWSEELKQEGLTYGYVGAERDSDLAGHCSAMAVRAQFRPFRPGLLWNTERGMELWLDGVATVPNPRVTATFRRGGDARAWTWDFPRWDRGERKVLDAGGALPWDPDDVSIEVSFPRSGYRFATTWPAR